MRPVNVKYARESTVSKQRAGDFGKPVSHVTTRHYPNLTLAKKYSLFKNPTRDLKLEGKRKRK